MKERYCTIIVPETLKNEIVELKFLLKENSLHSIIALGIEAIQLSNQEDLKNGRSK